MMVSKKDTLDIKEFLELYYKPKIGKKRYLLINFSDLAKFDLRIADSLLDNFMRTIELFNLGLNELDTLKHITPKFINFSDDIQILIRDIRSKDLEKLKSISGFVRKLTKVYYKITETEFVCKTCNKIITIEQDKDFVKKLGKCGCGGYFKKYKDIGIPIQKLILEEDPKDIPIGHQPQRILVILEDILTDQTITDKIQLTRKIRINGIIKNKEVSKNSTESKFFMQAHSIEGLRESDFRIKFTDKEIEEIKSMSQELDLKDKLIKSIAPNIYGYEKEKEACLLYLFGGVNVYDNENTLIQRGTIHLGIPGDVGTAKTQLGKQIFKFSQIATYCSGKMMTGPGLIGAALYDKDISSWSLEPGALPLAHGGIGILDELEKLDKEGQHYLNEIMSDLKTNFNKANIHQPIECDIGILGLWNPVHKRFDNREQIYKQFGISRDILDRFDLILPLIDKADKKADGKIIRRMLDVRKQPEEIQPYWRVEDIKKYITYAKQYIKPVLSKEAEEYIENRYQSLRKGEEGSTPTFSARLGEAIIRLSTAHAKILLSNKVTETDVKAVEELLMYSLNKCDLIEPETGKLKIEEIEGVTPKKTRDKYYAIKEILIKLSRNYKDGIIPNEVLIKQVIEERKDLTELQVEQLVEKLKLNGDVFEPKGQGRGVKLI